MAKRAETKWTKTESEVKPGAAIDTGDILAPLKRVQTQYLNRAAKHAMAGYPERAAYYQEQAVNVYRLLGDSLSLVVING